jgi:hypothetical protein
MSSETRAAYLALHRTREDGLRIIFLSLNISPPGRGTEPAFARMPRGRARRVSAGMPGPTFARAGSGPGAARGSARLLRLLSLLVSPVGTLGQLNYM